MRKVNAGELITENLNLVLFCFLIYVSGAVIGVLSFESFRGLLAEILSGIAELIVPKSPFQTAVNIVLQNTGVAIFLLLLGATILIPALIISFNGFMLGLTTRFVLSQGNKISFLLRGLLPHAIFELPAFFIAAAFGMRVGFAILKPGGKSRKAAAKERAEEAIAVFFSVILPLIVVAAFIEAYVTSHLVM